MTLLKNYLGGEKMQSIVLAELYKLLKRKNFIILAILSLWSLIYGFGAFLHWDFVKIGAKLDLVTFISTMWTFLLILTIPLLLILYILNCLTSLVTYICFISHTEFGYTRFWELHATNVQSIVVSLVNLGFIILLASIAFYLSLNISAIMASFASLGVYFLCQLLSNITMISKFIPGYFFVVPNYHFTIGLSLIHLLSYFLLCILLLIATMKGFESKAF